MWMGSLERMGSRSTTMKYENLVELARNELLVFQPDVWDTRAFNEFKNAATKGGFKDEEKILRSAYKDAIVALGETQPSLVGKYKQIKRKKTDDGTLVKWSEIICLGGVTNGDEITIRLKVRDEICVLEGTDLQFCDPEWVHRKIQVYTRQMVDFPFDKKDRGAWASEGLMPWLRHQSVAVSEHKTTEDIIIETLRSYCLEPVHVDSDPNAWTATRNAIYEDRVFYVAFAGFMDFLRRKTGTDHKRSITNALTRICIDGGPIQKRTTSGRVRFYRILKETLYAEEPDSSDAGEWEDGKLSGEGETDLDKAWDSIDDILRDEERRKDGS